MKNKHLLNERLEEVSKHENMKCKHDKIYQKLCKQLSSEGVMLLNDLLELEYQLTRLELET